MNKYRYLIENVIVFGLGNVVSKILMFLLLAIFTKYLTTKEFGDAELVITTISLLIPIFTLSISDATLRFLFGSDEKKSVVTNGLFSTVLGCLIISGISPICFLFGDLKNYVPFIILLFLFNSLEQLFFNVAKGLEHVKICAFNSVVAVTVLSFCSYIFVVKLGMGLYGYLTSIIASHIFCSVYLLVTSGVYKYIVYKSIDYPLLKEMLYYSIPFVPSSIAWWLNSLSDRYFVVLLLGSSLNGLYSAAAKIPNIISIFTTIFHQAWQLSGIKEYNDSTYSIFYSNIYNIFTVLITCFSSILICILPFIGMFLFKGEFYTAWHYVPFLVIGALFSGLSGVLSPAYLAAKKTKALMVSTLIGSFFNIFINMIFLKIFGLQVAAISTFISFLVVWIVRLRHINRFVQIDFKWTAFCISTILLIIQSIILVERKDICAEILVICIIIILINCYSIKTEVKKILQYVKGRFYGK